MIPGKNESIRPSFFIAKIRIGAYHFTANQLESTPREITMRLHALVILLVAMAANESNAHKHNRRALRRNTKKNQLMRRLPKVDDTKKSGTGRDAVEKKKKNKEEDNNDGGTETRTVVDGEELILPLNTTEAEVECTGDLAIMSSAPGYNNHQCEKSCQCASGCCAYVQSRVCVGLSAAITEDKCLH